MRIHQNKYHLLILYMLGFFGGILYANFIAKNYITVTGIFHEYFLSQYTQTDVAGEEYLFYLLRRRLSPFTVLIFAGYTRLKKAAVAACLLWTGFSGGVLAVAAVLRMGAKGMLFCLIGMFPQFLFYILGYAVALWYLYSYPDSRWNQGKTAFVAVMMLAGIILEAYVNPGIMKWFMSIVM